MKETWLTLACLALPWLGITHRSARAVLGAFGLALLTLGLAGWATVVEVPKPVTILIAGAAVIAWFTLVPARWSGAGALGRFFTGHRLLSGLFVMLSTLVVLVGVPEWGTHRLVQHGLAVLEDPVRAVLTPGTEDWRVATIVAGDRVPDPVLFWRPRAVPPYNEQRFKGPLLVNPKPEGVTRVMCYGDSNTDGPPQDGWAVLMNAEFERQAPGRRFEVVNAGVAGYSSYQGIKRFEEEVGTYRPDIVLVSYGWNDAPPCVGQPDREFTVPPGWVVALQRQVLKLKVYRMIRRYQHQSAGYAALDASTPRVSVDDYRANLRRFVAVGRQNGAKVVLLTRPYVYTTEQLAKNGGWRATVPQYNAAVVEVGREENVPVIDVHGRFDGKQELFIDECHFTMPGQVEMAQFMCCELLRPDGSR